MNIKLTVDGRNVVITTEHATSSYGLPVVLIDGVSAELDEYQPDDMTCSVLDMLADAAGVHNGQSTRDALRKLASEVLPENLKGADYDRVIAMFRLRGAETDSMEYAAVLIDNLLDSGKTMAQIAEHCGVYARTLYRWRNKLALPTPQNLKKLEELHGRIDAKE